MATLGAIKKAVTPNVATDVKVIMRMFQHICINNPDAVKASFGSFLAQKPDDEQARMVQFYKDNAEYLQKLFEYT